MNRAVLMTALAVWLLVSFVPQLSLASILGKRGKKG
jgi:hypothetical protein